MATSTSSKPRCAICNKAVGIFSCYGCSRYFCLPHANEHRQLLAKELDEEIVLVHDQLQQNFNEITTKPHLHPLMKEIDEWEQQSMDKIRQVADDARKQLLSIIGKHMDNIKISLGLLAEQLQKARTDDEFVETDIKEWKELLEKLKKEMNTPQEIKIQKDNNMATLIHKISINENSLIIDVFDRTDGNIRIEDNGRVIIHDQSVHDSAARGRCEYSSGQQRFRFKIEQLDGNKWAFFGIVSKNAAIQRQSYYTLTTYGWAGRNQVYLNGVQNIGFGGYRSDMEVNDVLELFVDCDRQRICLTNERTHSSYELDVNVAKCPFPWQLNFCLTYPHDRVHFLS
ncbi:unnamed protein product [Rotaria sp. Silwood1]|nr:unnamed protein product [Rotaria sp. Silwood1]